MFGIKTIINELRELKDFDNKVINLLVRNNRLLDAIHDELLRQRELMEEE